MPEIKKKTWATETAMFLLLVLCWPIYQENVELVKILVFPILTYATLAFGLKRIDISDKLFKS